MKAEKKNPYVLILYYSSGGHVKKLANQIALGIAMSKKDKLVYCFDGDGAALMHMGSLAILGQSGANNLVHIVFNNGAHASVGGQPTVGLKVDLCKIANACGYSRCVMVENEHDLKSALQINDSILGPVFVEVRTSAENRNGIGRPTLSPMENKTELMKFLGEN